MGELPILGESLIISNHPNSINCPEWACLTFTLPLGCSSSVTDTLSCCSRLFTSLEQQTLTAPCTCDALYSENVLLSITSKRLAPLWMRLARRLMSMTLRLVGPFSPAMFCWRVGVVTFGGSEVRVVEGEEGRLDRGEGWGWDRGEEEVNLVEEGFHWSRSWEIHGTWKIEKKQ